MSAFDPKRTNLRK